VSSVPRNLKTYIPSETKKPKQPKNLKVLENLRFLLAPSHAKRGHVPCGEVD